MLHMNGYESVQKSVTVYCRQKLGHVAHRDRRNGDERVSVECSAEGVK